MLSKKAERLVTAVHTHLLPAGTDALLGLMEYIAELERRRDKAKAATSPTRSLAGTAAAPKAAISRTRTFAANAAHHLMLALEFISNNEGLDPPPSRDAVASRAARATVKELHILDALEQLGLVNDFKLTALGTQMFSNYVNGDRDEAIDLVLTLF